MNAKAEDKDSLKETGRCAMAALRDMVAALECDYDRLAELREERAAIQEEGNPETEFEKSDLQVWDEANGEELAELTVAAGECESRDDAEQRIQEGPLSIEVRSDWYAPDDSGVVKPSEFRILLSTGGPAVRIMGDLNEHGEPTRAYLQVQDWGTPWTDYFEPDTGDMLLTYAQQFYFGEC